jgi:hypothetical protein
MKATKTAVSPMDYLVSVGYDIKQIERGVQRLRRDDPQPGQSDDMNYLRREYARSKASQKK